MSAVTVATPGLAPTGAASTSPPSMNSVAPAAASPRRVRITKPPPARSADAHPGCGLWVSGVVLSSVVVHPDMPGFEQTSGARMHRIGAAPRQVPGPDPLLYSQDAGRA